MNLSLQQPRKFTRIDGANGELVLVFQCLLHGSHVVIGAGAPGELGSALHLHVDEAMYLVEALNAGETWSRLADQVEGYRQGGSAVRSGHWCISLKAGEYWLSWKTPPFPLTTVKLSDVARAKLSAAVLELVAGKAAAA